MTDGYEWGADSGDGDGDDGDGYVMLDDGLSDDDDNHNEDDGGKLCT